MTDLFDEQRKQLQDRATQVIKPLIPPDAHERVTRAHRQFNQTVRDHIRSETALRLSDEKGQLALPVRIEDGFPIGLAKLIDSNRDPVLWRLILAQPRLGAIIDGLNFLLEDWEAFERWPHLPLIAKGGGPTLLRTRDIAAELQKVMLAQQVRQQVKKIGEDILGTYFFQAGKSPWIELYWMAIALVAAMQDVRIEDLTVVVLAHELTHGYTHIGRDIDGRQWDDGAFAKSEAGVIEGLAQFYTQVVAAKLATRYPGTYTAYEKLLDLQDGPYLAHKDWLPKEKERRGEAVRFTMIAARSGGAMEHAVWSQLLQQTHKSLRREQVQK